MVVNHLRKKQTKFFLIAGSIACLVSPVWAQPTIGGHDNVIGQFAGAFDDPNWRVSEPQVAGLNLPDNFSASDNQILESGIDLASRGFLQQACDKFRLVLSHDPDDAVARNNLATCLKRQGQLAEAIAEYKKAIAANPTKAELHNNLAPCLYGSKQLSAGVACVLSSN